MTDVELAWAAGLFDGEGSVYVRAAGRYPRAGAMLTLEMTDRPTVEAFARILAPHGRLYGSRLMTNGSQVPLWRWRASSQADVAQCGVLLLPYLMTKQAQVRAAMVACTSLDAFIPR